MKKIFLVISAAALMFVGCKKENPAPTTSFVLTDAMIQVNGLTEDCLTVVNAAAKTVTIEVAYADKVQLKALDVRFTELPSGVKADNFTFDFSTGATKTVKFTEGEASVEYVFSASAAQPEPKLVSATLNGVAVAGGTAKLKGSADLTKVEFKFEVSPAGTKVLVGQNEIKDGDEIDFSDKLNGVTFTLKCEDVEKTENIKVVTTGISSIERVWGHYVKPETTTDDWYGTAVDASGWERNITMDDKYVYMVKAGGPGVYAINIADGTVAKKLSVEDYVKGGVHSSSSAQVMNNGTSSVLLVSNMVNAANSILRIHAWDDIDSKPRQVLAYTLTEAHRFGDKFTVEGNWQKGRIIFYDYTSATERCAAVFTVNAGVIEPKPEIVKLGAISGNNIAGLYKFSDTEYIWAGTGAYPIVYGVSGSTFTSKYVCNDGARFSQPVLDVNFFTFNEQKYMVYARLLNAYQDGAIRFQEINYDTLAESMEKIDTSTDRQLGLGDPEKQGVTAIKNGNGCGACAVREINGEIYVAGCVMGAGVSVFKVK